MYSRYSMLVAACLAVAMNLFAGMAPVAAQTYPSQPIKIIIGFGPGSAADILARLIGKHMETKLGQLTCPL